MSKTLTTCVYCGCGCNFYLVSDGTRLTGAYPSQHHPVSRGAMCVKGWNAYEYTNAADRLKTPLIKEDNRFRPASWLEAIALVAERLTDYRVRIGPDSLGFFSSAKTTNEENYLMMKLARAVFKTNNIDHCARLCHASTVAGLAATFGSGAMTNSISEFEDADCFMVIGSDTTSQHPMIGSRIVNAVKEHGAKLLLVDPRKIALSKYATIHARHRNGTDVAWVNGMMNIIIKEGLWDRTYVEERTEGFDKLRSTVERYNPEYVSRITGVAPDQLIEMARIYASVPKAMIVYSMGITQHTTGVDNVKSLANLAMLTGHVGFPCTGVNPLRGQNNVQGACDMGALPNVFSGYQKVTDDSMRQKFEQAWKVDNLPGTAGLTITEMMNAAGTGEIKGLYIMGENPAISDPDLNHVCECLKKAEFLVVQDNFLTETAQYADVVLPAATFAEKDGTFTNTERRCQRVRKAINPPGEARSDWEILGEIASACGYDGMQYESPAELMDEIASLTPIYGGMQYDRLEPFGLQWPCPNREHPGTPYLHRDKFAKGVGTFMPCQYLPPAELPDEEYPFLLSTGRIYWHFHTGTMTRRTTVLNREVPAAYVEMNLSDADRLGVRSGDQVQVTSRRGNINLAVRVSDIVTEKSVFIPFHFAEAAANVLTNNAVDPVAKIPEYKVCAVKIEKLP